jgi:hypothetical protein
LCLARMKIRILLTALLAEATFVAAQTRDFGSPFVHQYVVGCLGVADDAFAVVRMPGSLPFAQASMAAVGASADWMSDAGGRFSMAAVKPREGDAFGIVIDHLRVGTYRSSNSSLSYGVRLSQELQAGMRIGFSHTRIDGYGSGLSLPVTIGAVYRMADGLSFSLHADHAGKPLSGGGPADERKPFSVHFGAGRRFSEQAGVALHVFKQEGRPLSIIPMVLYRPAGVLDIRAGLSTETSSFYLCIGYLRHGWRMDLSARHNGALGWATGIVLQWTAKSGAKP